MSHIVTVTIRPSFGNTIRSFPPNPRAIQTYSAVSSIGRGDCVGVFALSNPKPDDPYFRGRAFDQYSANVESSLFRSHSAMSVSWKG